MKKIMPLAYAISGGSWELVSLYHQVLKKICLSILSTRWVLY